MFPLQVALPTDLAQTASASVAVQMEVPAAPWMEAVLVQMDFLERHVKTVSQGLELTAL